CRDLSPSVPAVRGSDRGKAHGHREGVLVDPTPRDTHITLSIVASSPFLRRPDRAPPGLAQPGARREDGRLEARNAACPPATGGGNECEGALRDAARPRPGGRRRAVKAVGRCGAGCPPSGCWPSVR